MDHRGFVGHLFRRECGRGREHPGGDCDGGTRHTDHTVDILTWFDSRRCSARRDTDAFHVVAGSLRRVEFNNNDVSSTDRRGHSLPLWGIAQVIARRVDVPVVSREGNTRDGFTRKGRIANGVTNPLASRGVSIPTAPTVTHPRERANYPNEEFDESQTESIWTESTRLHLRYQMTSPPQTTLSSSATRPCFMNKRHRTR